MEKASRKGALPVLCKSAQNNVSYNLLRASGAIKRFYSVL